MRTVLILCLLLLAAYFGFNYIYQNNYDVFRTFTSTLLPLNKQQANSITGAQTSSTQPLNTTLDTMNPDTLPPASYEPYDDAKLAYARQAPVVLFFYASWCPSCQSTERIFAKKITSLPPGVKILKIDYDTATDLKEKYHIEYQHTFVQVDANGNELTRWSGGAIDGIVANLVQ